MSFPFIKKKQDPSNDLDDQKQGSLLDKFEEDLHVLAKDEMTRVEGGKSSNKSLSDYSDLRNSLGGTIPL
ncbi:MAG: hypothetical protein NW218_05045 [Saprospiraceae bacterium]|jgi:hypothetical protein|nr:hypothetical protein [Saprospiraceae bacterium]